MARAIKCDACNTMYKPDRKLNGTIVFPFLKGQMIGFSTGNAIQTKEWELCYECFEKINTYIRSLSKEIEEES